MIEEYLLHLPGKFEKIHNIKNIHQKNVFYIGNCN